MVKNNQTTYIHNGTIRTKNSEAGTAETISTGTNQFQQPSLLRIPAQPSVYNISNNSYNGPAPASATITDSTSVNIVLDHETTFIRYDFSNTIPINNAQCRPNPSGSWLQRIKCEETNKWHMDPNTPFPMGCVEGTKEEFDLFNANNNISSAIAVNFEEFPKRCPQFMIRCDPPCAFDGWCKPADSRIEHWVVVNSGEIVDFDNNIPFDEQNRSIVRPGDCADEVVQPGNGWTRDDANCSSAPGDTAFGFWTPENLQGKAPCYNCCSPEDNNCCKPENPLCALDVSTWGYYIYCDGNELKGIESPADFDNFLEVTNVVGAAVDTTAGEYLLEKLQELNFNCVNYDKVNANDYDFLTCEPDENSGLKYIDDVTINDKPLLDVLRCTKIPGDMSDGFPAAGDYCLKDFNRRVAIVAEVDTSYFDGFICRYPSGNPVGNTHGLYPEPTDGDTADPYAALFIVNKLCYEGDPNHVFWLNEWDENDWEVIPDLTCLIKYRYACFDGECEHLVVDTVNGPIFSFRELALKAKKLKLKYEEWSGQPVTDSRNTLLAIYDRYTFATITDCQQSTSSPADLDKCIFLQSSSSSSSSDSSQSSQSSQSSSSSDGDIIEDVKKGSYIFNFRAPSSLNVASQIKDKVDTIAGSWLSSRNWLFFDADGIPTDGATITSVEGFDYISLIAEKYGPPDSLMGCSEVFDPGYPGLVRFSTESVNPLISPCSPSDLCVGTLAYEVSSISGLSDIMNSPETSNAVFQVTNGLDPNCDLASQPPTGLSYTSTWMKAGSNLI